jgi:hypothetical protein
MPLRIFPARLRRRYAAGAMGETHHPVPNHAWPRRRVTLTHVVGGVLAGLMALPSSAVSGTNAPSAQLIDKAEIRNLFATSQQQWSLKVRHAAASGLAIPLGRGGAKSVGLSVPASHGIVSTVLRYDIGDDRPSAVLFVLKYSSEKTAFNSHLAEQIVATVKRQMAPEFHVVGYSELESDRIAFFFVITQSQTTPQRRYLTPVTPTLRGRPPTK